MSRPYQHIEVERSGEVFRVQLRQRRLDELAIHELAGELRSLILDEGCRNLALSIGPEAPECLYSIFLAKLISLQRLLHECGGELVLCNAAPVTYSIFEACCLEKMFHFAPDFDAAFGTATT